MGIAVGFAGGSSRLKIAFRNTANAIGNLKEGWLADFFKRLNHKKGRLTADWTVNTNTNSAQVALVAFLKRFNTGVSLAKQADVNTLMSLEQTRSNGIYGDLYGTMVSSYGNYTIKLTGTSSDIKTGFETDAWRKAFERFITDESGTLEAKFLRFMNEKKWV